MESSQEVLELTLDGRVLLKLAGRPGRQESTGRGRCFLRYTRSSMIW